MAGWSSETAGYELIMHDVLPCMLHVERSSDSFFELITACSLRADKGWLDNNM
jgi:hypothetical protein